MKPGCVFCTQGSGDTDDHVPPRCFFPTPPPANLITVPCGEACRLKDQKDDQFIRNLFISFVETEGHPAVATYLAPRRDKSFYEHKSMVPKLTEIIVAAEVRGPSGDLIGTAPAFNLDDPRVHRFIERVARAALHAAFGQTYFVAKFDWLLKPPISDDFLALAHESCCHRHIGNIFSFVTAPPSSDRDRFVVLTFYERLTILARFQESPENGANPAF
jgi:hypothetical protein